MIKKNGVSRTCTPQSRRLGRVVGNSKIFSCNRGGATLMYLYRVANMEPLEAQGKKWFADIDWCIHGHREQAQEARYRIAKRRKLMKRFKIAFAAITIMMAMSWCDTGITSVVSRIGAVAPLLVKTRLLQQLLFGEEEAMAMERAAGKWAAHDDDPMILIMMTQYF